MKHNKSIKIKRSKNRLYKKKKSGAKIAAETVIFVLIAGALVFVGYSAAGPLIKLWSGETETEIEGWTPTSPPQVTEDDVSDTVTGGEITTESITAEEEIAGEIGAYIMSENDISDLTALNNAINSAKESGYNQVILPMKNKEGKLLYKSNISYVKDTELVTGSMPAGQIASVIKAGGLVPKAEISALMDNSAPSYVDGAGYRFADDSYFWLDAAAANGGKRWLDPFLDGTKKYISDLSRELKQAGFEEIILSQLRFPDFTSYDQSILDNRSFTADRYKALTSLYGTSFNASEKKSSVSMDIKDVLAGYGEGFSGTAEILNDKTFTGTVYLFVTPSEFANRLEVGENRFIGLSPKASEKSETLIGKAMEYIGTNVTVSVIIDDSELSEEEIEECYNRCRIPPASNIFN